MYRDILKLMMSINAVVYIKNVFQVWKYFLNCLKPVFVLWWNKPTYIVEKQSKL